jgi:hypothetical protein
MISRIFKSILLLTLQCLCFSVFAQNEIEWDGNYQLQFADFGSATTQVGQGNIYSLHSGASFDFAFQMSNAEFMFTKNFNEKVNCTFNRNVASLIAPDTIRAFDLLYFSRYEFDLTELYARKFRKRLYDAKGAFSNAGFFQPVYDQIHKEYNERHVTAGQLTDLGHDRQKLKELHQEVLKEIESYADFCKTCKPPKKKK